MDTIADYLNIAYAMSWSLKVIVRNCQGFKNNINKMLITRRGC